MKVTATNGRRKLAALHPKNRPTQVRARTISSLWRVGARARRRAERPLRNSRLPRSGNHGVDSRKRGEPVNDRARGADVDGAPALVGSTHRTSQCAHARRVEIRHETEIPRHAIDIGDNVQRGLTVGRVQRQGSARLDDELVLPLRHARSGWMMHGTQPQQPERAGFGVVAGAELQPHPVPPVAFTSASRAQQAPAPSGAGPPQQPLPAAVASDGVALVDVLFDMMAPQLEAASIAALSAEDAGPSDRTQP